MFNQRRSVRRAATLLCAVLAGLGLGRGTAAQTPLPASPAVPSPYQSPVFHSGGAQDPTPASAVDPVPDLSVLLNGRLQGTPTGVVGTAPNQVATQIASFLLGNYDPTRPPTNPALTYYPNHFADGDVYSWQAPFNYTSQSTGFVSVDDRDAPPPSVTSSGFTQTGGWQLVTATGSGGAFTSDAAGTAANAEYLRVQSNQSASAVWQLYEQTAGSYSVYFNVPNDLPATPGGAVEPRSTSVLYFVTVRDANGVITATSTATVSQTDANTNQFLAGPFLVAANGTVTVTLTCDPNRRINFNNSATAYYIVADSMVLQAAIGDVQSTPTAINYESYPTDFALAKYWGIYVPDAGSPIPTVGATAAANAIPDNTLGATLGGTVLFHVGDPAQATLATGAADPTGRRRIRQLVYFGRSEPLASRSSIIDDNNLAAFTSNGGARVNGAFTASNGEYGRFTAVAGIYSAALIPSGTWTVPLPVGGTGNFFVAVHLPQTPVVTGEAGYPEARVGHVTYTVTYTAATGGTITKIAAISQVTGGSDGVVTLPTGALQPKAGTSVIVRLYNITGTTAAPAANSYVVADSVSLTTGTGQGAIYCVDGFTGGVVWRFETPGAASGASAAVFSSPAVAKINVLVPQPPSVTTPPVYQNKLVVVVGDNNGLVYCLDAIGNGDGTSNANVLDANGQPIYAAQPTYGQPAPAFDPANPHVGTTPVYWIYRPDATRPKFVTGAAGVIGTVKTTTDPTTDLPVPAAFGSASPTVFVNPNVTTTPDANGLLPSNATVYVGNSNGVLYALDARGVSTFGAATYAATGDTFNVPQDLRSDPTLLTLPAADADPIVPSCQPKWWFSLRGADPNGGTSGSSATIESAPALYLKTVADLAQPTGFDITPTVYIGSAHEVEAASNVGRLYALNGVTGPAGNNGRTDPSVQPDPTLPGYTGPGSFNYNVGQRPQTNAADTADWSFPDASTTKTGALVGYTHTSSDGVARAALGDVTGSPVVFTDTSETGANGDGTPRHTRIYFAANSGYEATTTTLKPTARPAAGLTGRLWAVNLDGTVGTATNSGTGGPVWSYPLAKDPNQAKNDPTSAGYVSAPEPQVPIGAFLHGTPALGYVQFPAAITNGDGSNYIRTDLVGQSVPMLYIGTRGSLDTALYAIDIDGAITVTTPGVATNVTDNRLVYRQPSPSGAIFQSSPVLITNSSTSGGNGGSVFLTAGNTFYDFGATPTSNPIGGQLFPLIRLNRSYTGFGPFSSPTVAATNIADLGVVTNAGGATLYGGANVTDWVYVGDSSTGFCRGITPNDSTYSGIPPALGDIVPPSVDAPISQVLDAFLQAFLMTEGSKGSASSSGTASFDIGQNAPLPVYEWGQSVYIRIGNVVPPLVAGQPQLYVYDSSKYDLTQASASNPIPMYTNGQAVKFSLADASPTDTTTDARQVPPVPAGTLPADGFLIDPSPKVFSAASSNLVDTNGKHWVGAYTYTIADGTGSRNTPGSRRTLKDIQQTVTLVSYKGGSFTDPASFSATTTTTILVGTTSNGNLVSNPTKDPTTGATTGYTPTPVQPVDQPTFGILNPLAVRGGGVDLLGNAPLIGGRPAAIRIGSDLGPYRGIASGSLPVGASTDPALEALANGNDVPQSVPPSSTGGGSLSPIEPIAANPNYAPPVTVPYVVVTSTALIPHGNTGDNGDPAGGAYPQGSGSSGNGLTNPDQQFGDYALDIFDRGALFPGLGQTLRAKVGIPTQVPFAPPTNPDGMYWNDNTANVNPAGGTGHDAVVNYLPWETSPTPYQIGTGGVNASLDYPSIAPGNIATTMHRTFGDPGFDLGSAQDLNHSDLPIGSQTVHANPVQISVSVPRFQPANQQLYQRPANAFKYNDPGTIENAPVDVGGNDRIIKADYTFPMGYVSTKRFYVPDRNGNFSTERPFRDVRVYTGVPPDFSTQMDNPTVEIGTVPSSFGVQTSAFGPLQNPTPGAGQTNASFEPFNPNFQANEYFKPLDAIHNTGNVNLLNVHLDQKQALNGAKAPLLLQSDALDPVSFISGFDYPGITGPRTGTFGAVSELPFLVRSSLDTDLVAAYGRNPLITNGVNPSTGASYSSTYPGATFHKARVGSGQPSTLTVPDAPDAYVPAIGSNPSPSLDVSPNGLPTHVPDGNNFNLPYKTPPFVSVAVPFGSPVGSYSAPLQLFEGLDDTGQFPSTSSGDYTSPIARLYPPRYGGVVGGIGTPNYGAGGLPLDTLQLTQAANAPKVNLMPVSQAATILNVKVQEDRLTDGAPYGTVPQVDLGLAGKDANNNPIGTPDFGPAAFRDPATGNLSVYWTSARTLTPASVSPYNVVGANVPFVLNPSGNAAQQGYFLPFDPTKSWWNPSTAITGPGTYSGLTVAQDPRNVAGLYAFAVDVTTPPYTNRLYSYPVTPGTGLLGSGQQVSYDDGQVKYGVKGLSLDSTTTTFTNNLWAFWTGQTRGRTAIYYNSRVAGTGDWPKYTDLNGNGKQDAGEATTGLLPIPAGLTAVSDPAPVLAYGNFSLNGAPPSLHPTITVTYSGTGPDGNVDLYESRYLPAEGPFLTAGTTANPAKLALTPFPAVTEILKATGQAGGWYQARDVAWARTQPLNLYVRYVIGGKLTDVPILYNSGVQKFSRAVFDRASGLLVISGVTIQDEQNGVAHTVYMDQATGRVRFSPALNTTTPGTGAQSYEVRALFSPLARRLTDDSRADTGVNTFLDGNYKANDAPSLAPVVADRRWYVWRKSGTGGTISSATIYYKTQRLTAFLPFAVDTTQAFSFTLNGTSVAPDVHNVPEVRNSDGSIKYPASARLYFPIQIAPNIGAEGATFAGSYTSLTSAGGSLQTVQPDTVQWQDEIRANDAAQPFPDSTTALAAVVPGYAVPLNQAVNENNVSAFLDPEAAANTVSTTPPDVSHPHKVWLFWNSTRNGTADVYYETINPRFAAGL